MSREYEIQLGKNYQEERDNHLKKFGVGALVTGAVALANPVVALIPGGVTLYQLLAAVDSQTQIKQRRS